jgi:hypothetical protein
MQFGFPKSQDISHGSFPRDGDSEIGHEVQVSRDGEKMSHLRRDNNEMFPNHRQL